MSHSIEPIELAAYREAVSVRDLTDPGQGPHAMQLLVERIHARLAEVTGARVRVHRANPVVPIEDNYDRLLYPSEGKARDARHTRYLSDRLLLRTQTSAMIPSLLEQLELGPAEDLLLVCPGIVYRRDQIDRLHSGEPHQLDLWRLRAGRPLTEHDLTEMVALVLEAALPGLGHHTLPASHPYTTDGLQIEVCPRAGTWVEVGECGLAHPRLLEASGLGPGVSGLALGLGLDRLLMLRKGIEDIRLLRSKDPRIEKQLLTLDPYQPVSRMPPVRCDLSVMVTLETTAEQLGDQVRQTLGKAADVIEELVIRGETPYSELPLGAVKRMGALPGQKNVLLHAVLRHLERTLSRTEANELRDRIYMAVHRGSELELIGTD